MKIINELFVSINNYIKKEREKKELFERQQLIRASWNSYTIRYWEIALSLWEIINENHRQMKLEEVSEPRMLIVNRAPIDINTFVYQLRKSSTYEDFLPTITIRKAMIKELELRGYKNFDLAVDEKSRQVLIRANVGFIQGIVLATNIGRLFYNNGYYIGYFHGGRSQRIKAFTKFELYFLGSFTKTEIEPTDNCKMNCNMICTKQCVPFCFPTLLSFNCHPDTMIGCIIRFR